VPAARIMKHIEKLNRLSESHGALRPGKPDGYGVVGDYVPNGYLKQLAFPFVWKG